MGSVDGWMSATTPATGFGKVRKKVPAIKAGGCVVGSGGKSDAGHEKLHRFEFDTPAPAELSSLERTFLSLDGFVRETSSRQPERGYGTRRHAGRPAWPAAVPAVPPESPCGMFPLQGAALVCTLTHAHVSFFLRSGGAAPCAGAVRYRIRHGAAGRFSVRGGTCRADPAEASAEASTQKGNVPHARRVLGFRAISLP